MYNFDLPGDVNLILDSLNKCGFESYIVGGCVRDIIMQKTPHDWDICTSALPGDTLKVFKDQRCIETGIKHGTVTVLIGDLPYEITTFRKDGDYFDFRRPETVEFTDDLTLDLSRRDFTVNAMAYSPKRGFVDPFGGAGDINKKTLRCVGEPEVRFHEDALRIMRALRFSSVLGFEIENSTKTAAKAQKHLLKNISNERIFDELKKLLCGDDAEKILMQFSDVLFEIIPELKDSFEFLQYSKYHIYDVWHHTAISVSSAPPSPVLRLSMLLHDVAKPACFFRKPGGSGHFPLHCEIGTKMANEILTRLKADKKTITTVCTLIKYHDTRISKKVQIKKLLSKIGSENFALLLEMQKADALAKNPIYTKKSLELISEAEKNFKEILKGEECYSLKTLDINGFDVEKLGFSGKKIGEILNALLSAVIEEKVTNKKNELLKFFKNKM